MSGHARFEELAVGHVLGGLRDDDAVEFREHLIGCRECRLRVAELRDIAVDLAEAERDEQQRAQTKVETARRVSGDDPAADRGRDRGRPWRPTPQAVAVSTLLLVAAAVAAALWSFHLRTVNAQLLAVADRQEQVMQTFATGVTVPATFTGDTRGRVAVTDEMVAVTFVGVPVPASDQRVVLWLVAGDEAAPVMQRRSVDADGRLAAAVAREGADRLLLTLEPWPGEPGRTDPRGEILVSADLDGPERAGSSDPDAPRASLVESPGDQDVPG